MLVRIISMSSVKYVCVDEEAEVLLREVAKKGDIDEKIQKRVLVNKHAFDRELKEGDGRLD